MPVALLPAVVVRHAPVVGPHGSTTGAGRGVLGSSLLYVGVVLAGALVAPELLRRRARWAFERVLTTVAVLTVVILAATKGEDEWGTALITLHLAVVTIWVGAVLQLAVATVLRRRTDWRAAAKAFTPIAVTSAALVAVTGVLMALRDHVSWTALVSTTFGGLVLLKAVALAIAAVLGLGHRLTRDNRAVALLLRGEASVLAVALAFGSALIATAAPAAAVTVALPGISTVALPGAAPVSLFVYDDNGRGRLQLLSDEDIQLNDRSTGVVTQLAAGAVVDVALRRGNANVSIVSGESTRKVQLRAVEVRVPATAWAVTREQRTAFALGRVLARTGRNSPVCVPAAETVHAVAARLLRHRPHAEVVGGTSTDAIRRLQHIASSADQATSVTLEPSLLDGQVLAEMAQLRLPPVTVVGVGDPMSTVADRYRAALQAAGGGTHPTVAGLLGWESALAPASETQVRLFAAAPIGFLPGVLDVGHTHADAGWIPGGALVATGPTASVALSCYPEVAR